MKPPVVHQSVQPPAPTSPLPEGDAEQAHVATDIAPPADAQGLVGSYGPIIDGTGSDDQDGAAADELNGRHGQA